jgi:hypothetical protein
MPEIDDNQRVAHPSEAITTGIPPEIGKQVQSFMAMIQSSNSRPPVNPLFEKFTEAHIDKYLDYIQKDDDSAIELKKTNRWFNLAYFFGALVAVGLAIYHILPIDKDFLQNIIQVLLAFAGGFGAGYGVKSREDK